MPRFTPRRTFLGFRILSACTLLACFYAPAFAQGQAKDGAPESEPYGFRTQPANSLSSELEEPFNYQGEPLTFNGFRIWPNLTLRQEYDDNIIGTENGTDSDLITVLRPEIEIWKSFGRHDFSLLASSNVRRYWKDTDENTEDYNLLFEGNLEAKQGLDIPMRVLYRDGFLDRTYQRRSSANQITVAPLNTKRFEAETGIVYKPNRLKLSLMGGYKNVRLGNEKLITGGTLIRDNRNVNVISTTGEISYDLKNGVSPFIRMQYTDEDYFNENAGALSRNNTGLQTLAGVNLSYKGLIRGFIGAGIQNRYYEEATIDDTSDVAVMSEIEWEPTAKTRFSFNALRETKEDNLLIARLTKTGIGAGVEHEFLHDTFGRLNVHWEKDTFDDINREDETLDTNIEFLKIIGPHLQVGAGYNYVTRDSSIQGLGMDNSVVYLRVKTAL